MKNLYKLLLVLSPAIVSFMLWQGWKDQDRIAHHYITQAPIPAPVPSHYLPPVQSTPDGLQTGKLLPMPIEDGYWEAEVAPEVLSEASIAHTAAFDYDLGEARLIGEAGSLQEEIKLSINGLDTGATPPLGAGMVNVTGQYSAYRMLPHGTYFNKDIQVILPYDSTLLPRGFTPRDIRSYYYNDTIRQWVAIRLDSVDTENQKILSRVNHFTDFINAIIKTPEMPETQAYTPNSIKDIKAANPLEGMSLMQPPTANNMGTANISYPLQIPAGRQGMQPNLALQYNSGGGNGWLGVGWDIPIPAITVETRWGVPHYNAIEESETYIMNGEQLTPMAHREKWKPRDTIDRKQFYPRVEGAFNKIIRHGTTPRNYYWEVIDRNGMRYYYGKVHGSINDINSSAILADHLGNIAHWALTETVDLSGNHIRYYYDIVYDAGNAGGSMGKQIYIREIKYTGWETDEEGAYRVEFKRIPKKADEGGFRRVDVNISARYGFKEVTADLLREVKTYYHDELIKNYYFGYTSLNQNMKTLLCGIVEDVNELSVAYNLYLPEEGRCAAANVNENFLECHVIEHFPVHHKFTYYSDDISYDSKATVIENYDAPDGLEMVLDILKKKITCAPTALGGSFTSGWGIGGTLAGGFGKKQDKSNSIGGNFYYSKSKSEGKATIIDLDGDGLPDKVFKSGNKVYYRKQEKAPNGSMRFGEKKLIEGIGNFLNDESTNKTFGFEALVKIDLKIKKLNLNLSFENGTTNTSTKTYFVDVNKDGLPDIVSDAVVYFNQLNPNKIPVFKNSMTETSVQVGPNSCDTISFTGEVNPLVFNPGYSVLHPECYHYPCSSGYGCCNPPVIFPDIIQFKAVNYDAVKMWVAPCDGKIHVTALLNKSYSQEDIKEQAALSGKSWGTLRFHVQLNDNAPSSNDIYETMSPLKINNYYTVKKGDKLFFRLISSDKENRAQNSILFDPVIQYTHTGNSIAGFTTLGADSMQVDANGYKIYRYTASEEFLKTSKGAIEMPDTGQALIQGCLRIPALTDTVKFQIIKNEQTTVYSRIIPAGQATNILLNQTFNVVSDDVFEFVISANTNITWERITVDSLLCKFSSESSDAVFYPYIHYTLYQDVYSLPQPFFLMQESTVEPPCLTCLPIIIPGDPDLPLPPFGIGVNSGSSSGEIISGEGMATTAMATTTNSVEDQYSYNIKPEISFKSGAKTTDSTIIFTVKYKDKLLAKKILKVSVLGQVSGNEQFKIPIPISSSIGNPVSFEYHTTNRLLAKRLNSCNVKVVDINKTYKAGFYIPYNDSMAHFGHLYRGWGQFVYNDTSSYVRPIQTNLLKMPDIDTNFAGAESIGNSEFDDTDDIEAAWNANGMYNPLIHPFINMYLDSKEGSWKGFGGYGTITANTMSNSCDEIDLGSHGNPIPRTVVINTGDTQYVVKNYAARAINKQMWAENKGLSAGVSAKFKANPSSFGASHSWGHSEMQADFMDINGDGYPDVVGVSNVHFSKPQGGLGDRSFIYPHAGDGYITNKTTFDANGGNLGTSFTKNRATPSSSPSTSKNSINLFATGGGSMSKSTNNIEYTWLDINGDGLPDKVFTSGKVALNLGYRFSDPEPWPIGNIKTIQKGVSNLEGISVGGGVEKEGMAKAVDKLTDTLVGNIFKKLFDKVNASFSAGVGVSHSDNIIQVSPMDVNGDGLIDIIEYQKSGLSAKPGHLMIYLNTGTTFIGYVHYIEQSDEININASSCININANGAFTISFPFWILKACVNPKSNTQSSFNQELGKMIDMNGDGLPDFVEVSSLDPNKLLVYYAKPARVNLLYSVSNFAGGGFEINYTLSECSYESPQRSWQMASITTHDGLEGDGASTSYTTFAYESPFYNRFERQAFGYAKVTSRQHNTEETGIPVYRSTTEYYYNRDLAFKGLKYEETVRGPQYVGIRKTYCYILKEVSTGLEKEQCDGYKDPCANFGTLYPALSEVNTYYYAPSCSSGYQQTHIRYEHGSHGNVIAYYNDGSDIDFYAEIEYYQDTTRNILGVPKQIVVKDGNGEILRKRNSLINPYTCKPDYIETFSGTSSSSFNLGYDEYGNLNYMMMPPNGNNQRMQYYYTYDPSIHSLVTVIDDNLGFTSFTDYDYKFQVPVHTMDKSGIAMQYAYDNRGRLKEIWAPRELESGYKPTIQFQYWDENWIHFKTMCADEVVFWWMEKIRPLHARTFHYLEDHPDEPLETVLFVDGFGRVVQTKKDAVICNMLTSENENKMVVSGKVHYDAFGRVVQSWMPTVEDMGMDTIFSTDYDDISPTTVKYDALDRPVLTTLPDGTQQSMEYNCGSDFWGYQRMKIVATDANGNATTSYTNAQGKITAIQSAMDTWTYFRYNPLGELLTSIDPEENETHYEYDWLGRCIRREHPDAGVTEMEYDGAGNLIRRTQNGIQVDYEYDYNRPTAILYPEHPENNVYYQYGAPDAGPDAGRLIKLEDASGLRRFFYGTMGELKEEMRTFVLPYEDFPYSFRMKYDYDSWNRMMSMTYPDGEQVQYQYFSDGQLRAVEGDQTYIQNMGYDKFGRKVHLTHGNGTASHYEYDEMQRLSHLWTHSGNSEMMQNVHYQYDPVGNIKIVSDNIYPLDNQWGGSSFDQYTYDNNYRLVGAEGHFMGINSVNAPDYQLNMEYSLNGKINRKTLDATFDLNGNRHNENYDATYTYQQNRLTGVSGMLPTLGSCNYISFDWDVNGNMMQHSSCSTLTTHCWDEENRLMVVHDIYTIEQPQYSHFIYDAQGERTFKASGLRQYLNINGRGDEGYSLDNITLYVSPYLVVSPQGYTKHYYNGSSRVCSRLGTGMFDEIDDLFDWNENKNEEDHRYGNEMFLQKLPLLEERMQRICADGRYTIFSPKNALAYLWDYKHNPDMDRNQPDETYYYHTDHLGSSNWITDHTGYPIQFLRYLPYGELQVEQRATDWNSMYTFSGKEKDEETGYSYFGARYYIDKLGIWMSVDPLAHKYPEWSSYNYCLGNPLKFIDPDGREVINEHEAANQRAEGNMQTAQTRFNDRWQNVEARNLRGAERREYKTDLKNLNKAIRTYNDIHDQYNKAQEVIDYMRINCPGDFNYYNTLTDGTNTIDVAVGAHKQRFTVGANGENYDPFGSYPDSPRDKSGFMSPYPLQGLNSRGNRYMRIGVSIETPSDDYINSGYHEFRHVYYFFNDVLNGRNEEIQVQQDTRNHFRNR